MNELINDASQSVEMTYEEAAQIIKNLSIYTGRRNGKVRLYAALYKAIEVLEAYGKDIHVLYLCDRKKKDCPKTACSNEYCSHTSDIRHAINFNKFVDIDREDGSKFLEYVEIDQWIPIKSRPGTDEEYQNFIDFGGDCPKEDFRVYNSQMPEDGQEVLITTQYGDVVIDIWHDDIDSCYFEDHDDPDDVIAWMPKPEGYKSEVQDADN